MRKIQQGFTIIELVIVIAILSILAGIAIPRFLEAQASARGAKIVADLRTIDSAAMIYQAKAGILPASSADLTSAANTANGGHQLLAAWPVPAVGTFIVPQLAGGEKTFKDITAAAYTLNSYGRGEYDSHTVDYYLGLAEEDTLVAALKARLNQKDSAILNNLVEKKSHALDSENTLTTSFDKEVAEALRSAGVDTTNSSWALRYNPGTNTVKFYVTDHKITYNNDRGKQVQVQIYTGTVTNGSVTGWNGPVSGTAGITSANGNGIYAKLSV